jgi:hypothetical protein
MKRLLVLLLALMFVVGCGNTQTGTDTAMGTTPEGVTAPPAETNVPTTTAPEETVDAGVYGVLNKNAIVDRNKYLVGGKEMFDTAKIFFTQKAGMGFDVTVSGGENQVAVEVMVGKECTNLDDGLEYEVIESKEGTSMNIVSQEPQEEQRDICINVKAMEDGEITAHVTVEELELDM